MNSTALFALLVAAMLAVAAKSPSSPPRLAGSRTIIDQRDATLALPPHIDRQAVLFGTGVGPFILANRRPSTVHTASTAENRWIGESTYLDRALPKLGEMSLDIPGTEGGSASIENVLLQKPDVVVTWARLADNFERLGMPVVGVAPISSVGRVFGEETMFAALAGRESISPGLRAALQDLERRVAQPNLRPAGFIALHATGEGRWQIAHLPPEIVTIARGIDLGRIGYLSSTIGVEELLRLDPSAIVYVGASFTGRGDMPSRTRAMCALDAIRQGRAVDAPVGLTGYMIGAVEMPLYAAWLANLLYPVETKLDVRKETSDKLQMVFGVTPTSDEIDRMYPTITTAPICKGL